MYDIIYEFINNSLFGTTTELYNLPKILSVVSVILIYCFLVKVLLWVLNYFSWRS